VRVGGKQTLRGGFSLTKAHSFLLKKGPRARPDSAPEEGGLLRLSLKKKGTRDRGTSTRRWKKSGGNGGTTGARHITTKSGTVMPITKVRTVSVCARKSGEGGG